MTYCHIDIESRSRIDLKKRGAYIYAQDPSTEILWISWALGDDDPSLWFFKDPFPAGLREIFENSEIIFKAHNAAFERLMFWYILCPEHSLPEPPIERFYCTATQARANALPDKLELCARALGAQEQKDHKGAQLIQKLSIPNKDTGQFNEDPELMIEFGLYCQQDVRTERSITHAMRDLTEVEQLDYIVSEEINDRGIMVDVDFATVVCGYADIERDEVKRRVTALTRGEVLTAGSPKFTTWVHALLPEKYQHVMETTKNKSGFCFDSNVVDHLFDISKNLGDDAREAIRLKAMASKSSVSKFEAMVNRADPESDRVCGAFVLFGAGQTHRYSSRGLQLHNMARDTADEPFVIQNAFIDGTIDPEDLFSLLKSMIRPSLMPAEGKVFVCLDWSGIEARVLPWETNDSRAEPVLDVFRRGEDIYLVAAEDMPGNDRQLGKVATLALGYQGGVHAFQSMAHNYGVFIEDSLANRIKFAWRDANPWAVGWWNNVEAAAKRAVRNEGVQMEIGVVKYVYLAGVLYCILPSGTILSYPQPRLEFDPEWNSLNLTCLKASRRPKADDPEWPRMALYGGLLTENITQAIAADLLREALVRVREWSDEVVLHVHDEIVLEVDEDYADEAMEDLRSEMLVIPAWAEGLPLDVGGWIGDYYRKD